MLVTGLMASVMFFVWRVQKTYSGTKYWVLSNFAGALGFLLIGLRGFAPELITVVIGNILAVGTTAFALHGNRLFLELPSKIKTTIVVMTAYTLSLIFSTYLIPDVIARIIAASVACSILAFLSYRSFEQSGKAKNIVYNTVGLTFLLFSILMFFRMAATLLVSNLPDLYTPDWIQSLYFMLFLTFATVWSLNYVVLNSERLNEELRSKEAELLERATTDYLTGLSNKQAFFEFAASEIKRSRRYNIPACIVLLDLDHFKQINDSHGHAVGDTVLKEIGGLLKRMTRQHDLVARLGGEEFGLMLTHTNIERGHIVAEAFRREIAKLEIEHSAVKLDITSSFGVAELGVSETVESLIERADANLYKAKALGRNRVVSDKRKELRLLSKA